MVNSKFSDMIAPVRIFLRDILAGNKEVFGLMGRTQL
jgi:hypothetical protein